MGLNVRPSAVAVATLSSAERGELPTTRAVAHPHSACRDRDLAQPRILVVAGVLAWDRQIRTLVVREAKADATMSSRLTFLLYMMPGFRTYDDTAVDC